MRPEGRDLNACAVVTEHLCPPSIPGQPQCDPFAETAPRHDDWMILLPEP